MLDEILAYQEQRSEIFNRGRKQEKIMIIISSLELGKNKDWTFSRYLMRKFLETVSDLPAMFFIALISEGVFMARRESPFLGILAKFLERGEVIVHLDSWKHYFPEEDPFIGTLKDMSHIASKIVIADKVITLG